MKNFRIIQWLRIQLITIKSSIAFYPAIIALSFLVFSFIVLRFEQSDMGDSVKEAWKFLDLNDASTARAIVGTIAAGILSLTVFSFSMVMIVLNQAASNMTNRLLDLMINNRFQQLILGIYIGTIMYGLFLFSRISEAASTIPGLSIFILMVFAIIDIFLFIYFLHYITQSVKIDTNIRRIFKETMHALKSHFPLEEKKVEPRKKAPSDNGVEISSSVSGYFQEYRKGELIELCKENDWTVEILIYPGDFVLEGKSILRIFGSGKPKDEDVNALMSHLDFYDKQDIGYVPYWGFHQLMEISLKALSPGINDPVSAVRSMNKMAELLRYRLLYTTEDKFEDENGVVRIFFEERSAENIVKNCFLPIWDYGKNDRQVVEAVYLLTKQLLPLCKERDEKNIIQLLSERAKEVMSDFEI